ncbi:hypothetical protein N4G70_27625 [Streptomyces sp. ASQP_92]|uniref:hypothetical protein n=1 Tax=Streptomyces sp. ASQP_92 TaxID=2979116 RepID=UPI0021C1D0A4|nr:hypothetical protein [Streptomyces sp. ASQP_92]MCT9092610.1 hypothetical protein [Streptomyces sp. ASQP_92]
MCSTEARAHELVARLTAAGFTPRLQDQADRIAIEVDVPDLPSSASWHELFGLLGTADEWGLDSGANGRTARAALQKKTPAT